MDSNKNSQDEHGIRNRLGPAARMSVFVSYSNTDADFCMTLQRELETRGIDVTGDWRLQPGEKYPDQLRDLIAKSTVFVFIISRASLASPPCRWELARAVRDGKRIQTVGLEDRGHIQLATADWPPWCDTVEAASLPSDQSLNSEIGLTQWIGVDDPEPFDTLAECIRTDLELAAVHTEFLAACDRWLRSGRRWTRTLGWDDLRRARTWLALIDAREASLRPRATVDQRAHIAASAKVVKIRTTIMLAAAAVLVGTSIALVETRAHAAERSAREVLTSLQLPVGIMKASELETLFVETPLARLDWVPQRVRSLHIRIDEQVTPSEFPPFLTDLAIVGNADDRIDRYFVDVSRLPRTLSSLTLQSVNVRNADQLQALGGLRSLTLVKASTVGPDFALPSGLERVNFRMKSWPTTLTSLALEGGDPLDAANLPRSLKSLALKKVILLHPEALPSSLTTLSIIADTIDGKNLRFLNGKRIEDLTISAGLLRDEGFLDAEWLPSTLRKLTLHNVLVAHPERLSSLTGLTEIAAGYPDEQLPASTKHVAIGGCSDPADLKALPPGIERLELGCVDEFHARALRRFPSLRRFTALGYSEDFHFAGLPVGLTQLAIGAAAIHDEELSSLHNLTDLSLDLTPGSGGSDIPIDKDRELGSISVGELPRGLMRLRVLNLIVEAPGDLAGLDSLRSLTVDRYNRRDIGIPRSLRTLIILDRVSGDSLTNLLQLPHPNCRDRTFCP